MSSPRATIDFETRSACDLKACGAWKYSLDPTTEILCLAFRLPHWEKGRTGLWTPKVDKPYTDNGLELAKWIAAGGLVEAHNAAFERAIWQNILVPRYGWPAILPWQWRCSAAKAAVCGLPRHLADAADALGLDIRKGDSKVMLKMCKPRKPRKAERERGVTGLLWWDTPELRAELYSYCRQDVLAEEALSEALPDLSEDEQAVYALDQTINERGFSVDLAAVDTALRLIAAESARLNSELDTITDGAVTAATQRGKLAAWLGANGVVLDDTTKESVEAALSDPALSDQCRRVLTILAALGKASTAKYETMRDWAAPDGKIRGSMLYHGAGTGRWTGSGVQPHNFPRGEKRFADQHALWSALQAGTVPEADIMSALSSGLRGAIVASPGHQLYVADYAQIEARVVLWLAEDAEALKLFAPGQDIYSHLASEIYGRKITKTDPERQLGKIAVLGLGYGMGAGKFADTVARAGIPIEKPFAEKVVATYRDTFKAVKYFWYRQEDAAIKATLGAPATEGLIRWARDGRFLTCQLPSGRLLYYPDPSVEARETPWGDVRDGLIFKGVNKYAHSWGKQRAYGGMLVENIVQAVARDILAAALLRCEASRIYLPILSIHDEAVTEAKLGTGSVEEFVALMEKRPAWAFDCPIAAEGWTDTRYRK